MSESRQELLAWVNQLCQTNYTKIEHLGTGAAYCQILDSIYYDVPLSRVKFSAKNDYEYINNLKVLQNVFKKHKIDKPVLAENLKRLKFQDNFEFLQWLKRYWDAYNPNTPYDALGRRRGQHVEGPVGGGGVRPGSSASSAGRTGSRSGYRTPGTLGASRAPPVVGARGVGAAARGRGGVVGGIGARGGMGAAAAGGRIGGAGGTGANSALVQDLTNQLNDAKVLLDTAEKERDFYFSKLREIEIMTQQIETEEGSQIDELIKQIQEVLYNTEESVIPEENGQHHEYEEQLLADQAGQLHIDDNDETF
ncbi:microtubule integrity protein mal3 [Mycoemilia scoparia]|uniref:Microtubule integrity protein mal3 n=1 Tax=Mycoemilia scoparia TaxID=417184 RepID=A0A9W8DND0_9FUNG|nr:microtubule integrity protein mal3 [Mycoemilia scoparia]